MIPFYLVTGFLGSGKTTLLKRILERYADDQRIAIIQNEFAPTGTDSADLHMTGKDFSIMEINKGSVFCVCQMHNFSAVVRQIIEEYHPDMLFLEASGLSDPLNILELLQDEKIREFVSLAQIITVVDASNFSTAVHMMTRVKHQVMIADRVLVNKTDLARERVEETREMAGKMNPFAAITMTNLSGKLPEGLIPGESTQHSAAVEYGTKEPAERPDMKACVLRTNRRISREGLHNFITEMQTDCPRVKGFVVMDSGEIRMIQSVFDDFESTTVSGYTGPGEIVAFGEGLTPGLLKKRYERNAL